jgi:dihydroflavonol-4-reductase
VSRSRAHSNELFHLHVQGTRRVLEAMKRKGCQRVVLASTSGTVAVSTTPEEKDEDSPYCEEIVRRWPYYHSKIYAERSVLHAVASGEIEAVILRPSLLLGPGDRRLSSTRDVRNILKGRYVLAPQGGISFVDVRDAAAAFVTAGFEGVNGRRYLLSGANMSTREFIDRVCVIGNKRPSLAPLPSGVSKRAQRILQRMRLSDLATTLEMSRYFWYVDASRARSEIGFAPRLPTQTLQDTVDWLADQSVR